VRGLAVAGTDAGALRVWDVSAAALGAAGAGESPSPVATAAHGGGVASLCWAGCGQEALLAGAEDGKLTRWRLVDGGGLACEQQVAVGAETVMALACDGEGATAFCASGSAVHVLAADDE
jgi:hypothetical protein